MAGAQFEYDQSGFFYFVLSFFALVLIPCTFYLWPRSKQKEDAEDSDSKSLECRCPPCEAKRSKLQAHMPWNSIKRKLVKVLLIVLWALFFLLAYRVSMIEKEGVEYDPYSILGVDRGASTKEIRKAYKDLSLKFHPDKQDGNEDMFVKISKAHQALTDDEARKNWEEYGNPDGPGATTFGIALPPWIVERENSVWVLAAYGLVFMVALPVAVGSWWYRSIKYSGDQVLLDTTRLYQYFFHHTPSMVMKRVIMILTASFEFDKRQNPEVQERPSDNVEIPQLFKDLPHVNEKTREAPFRLPYATKCRALIHSHLTRLSLPSTLAQDREYMLKKCPLLVAEMVNTVSNLVRYSRSTKSRCPTLDTMENCMRLSQMIVQGLWDNKSSLLQLPHFAEDMMRHCINKKRTVRSLRDLVRMPGKERRDLMRNMSDDQYGDVVAVLKAMPYVTLDVKSEVIDDEESCTITANALVTMTVTMTRQNMSVLSAEEDADMVDGGRNHVSEEQGWYNGQAQEGEGDEQESESTPAVTNPAPATAGLEKSKQKTSRVWEKQAKKKKGKAGGGGGGGGGGGKKKKPQYVVKKDTQPQKTDSPKASIPNGDVSPKCKAVKAAGGDGGDEESKVGSNSEASEGESGWDSDDEGVDTQDRGKAEGKGRASAPEQDEEEWLDKFQQDIAKKERKLLEGKTKNTVPVHCPYYPDEKYEWWWLYVCDRKNRAPVTLPCHVTTLRTREEVQLKFPAPPKAGHYTYSVVLRSDSYLDVDIVKDIKLDVKEMKKVEMSHPQWDISSDEDVEELEHDHDAECLSDYTTEESESE